MRDDQFDPYRPSPDGRVPDDTTVLRHFLDDLEQFIQDVFDNPPDVLRGEWLDEQREVWDQLRQPPGSPPAPPLSSRLPTQMAALEDHGLSGSSFRSKLRAWRDNARAFLARRGTQRLARALRTGGVVMDSVADALGVGHAYKEVIKGLHHLTELVIEEGP